MAVTPYLAVVGQMIAKQFTKQDMQTLQVRRRSPPPPPPAV